MNMLQSLSVSQKIHIFALLLIFCSADDAQAQLFSSGNNVIAGSNVGIGFNAPTFPLHIRRSASGSNNLLALDNPNGAGSTGIRFLNDSTARFGALVKYGGTYPGGFGGISTLYPYANVLGFANNGSILNQCTGNMGFSVIKNGVNNLRLHLDANTLNVGIGGASVPAAQVHFNSNISGDTLKITNSTTGHNSGDGLELRTNGNAAALVNRENSTLDFGTNNTTRIRIRQDGNVVIGNVGALNVPAGYKLYVEQGVLTEKVKVAVKTSADWSDYVFADNYPLRSIEEVKAFVNTNDHLPGLPSASEVVSEGIDVAKMDAKLLEKIEELTLYIFQLNERISKLEDEMKNAEK